MKHLIYISFILVILGSCRKPEDRKCFKGLGEYTETEIPLDSVDKFNLYRDIKYRLVEDSTRKIVLKGGSNMLNNIEIEEIVDENGININVRNNNTCNFLRDGDAVIEAEVHYPYFRNLYIEPSDSVIVEDTLHASTLKIELREGGGSAVLTVATSWLQVVASFGTMDYTVNGTSNYAIIKVQNNSYCDVTGFSAPGMFLYQNSTGDIKCDLEGTNAEILLEGTGNVLYMGNPESIDLEKVGSGEVINL